MIPLRLKLSGFLSYREPVEIDFSGFDLACISGQNGAGKSSLLDAMTWALFGQARKRDESVINLQSTAAEVSFTFGYENNQYRVIRSLVRGKTTTLEFQISDDGTWRPLTEHTNRETQNRIEQVLRLDYDTFINVSFFLQGRADQFAQQPPTRRKEILGNILGLEIWEVYKERAAERRKLVESDLSAVDVRMTEIDAELSEEEPRKARLAELEMQLGGLTATLKAQETTLAAIRQSHLSLDKQRELIQKMRQSLEHLRANLAAVQTRLIAKQAERQPHADLLARAAAVETAYAAWQAARLDMEKWEQIAGQFRQHEKRRLPFLDEINAEKAKLEQEKSSLEEQASAASRQASVVDDLKVELQVTAQGLKEAEEKLLQKSAAETQAQAAREQQAGLCAENKDLKIRMEEFDARIKKLKAAEGAVCPLCGQSLSPEHRQTTLDQLNTDGTAMGDRYRLNKAVVDDLTAQLASLDTLLSSLSPAENERMRFSTRLTQLTTRLEAVDKQQEEWEKSGAKRLVKVKEQLGSKKFAIEARKSLVKVDKELSALGYDASTHDATRQIELQARSAEGEYRLLESARAALKPLDDEIASLRSQISEQQLAVGSQQKEFDEAAVALAAVEAQAPDLETAEQSYREMKERENLLSQEVGGARQNVNVLDIQRKRRKKLEVERGELGLQIGRYKVLERAFGKDGVPALLIEQALPEIEMKANEILGRLSDDTMRLHFETQAKYKDEKRKDLHETLEIQVSDGAGERDYEMFSGGEAFRVNFAIRLALSEVLAQRKGARLQLLVIDEGFGSQDTQGRQRLIQAINAVRADFAKILVITHLDELKDAFPNRIEVEKTEAGSTVKVM